MPSWAARTSAPTSCRCSADDHGEGLVMRRTMLVLGLALVLAALGTGAVFAYVRQADARAVAGKEAVSVLVAGARVPAGTTAADAVKGGLLRVDRMPRDTVPADALATVDSEVGPLVAGADIQPG